MNDNHLPVGPGAKTPGSLGPAPVIGAENTAYPEAEPSLAETALIKQWTERIATARRYHEPQFKRMRNCAAFARGRQWPGMEKDKDSTDSRYVANFTLRHVANKTAALYAKNPRAVATRRRRLDYAIWDGKEESMQQAVAAVAQASQAIRPGQPMDPSVAAALASAQRVLEDIQGGFDRRKMLDRISKTLEIVYDYEVKEQLPPFKTQMKQLVRRTITAGVGYVKLGYHRMHELRPEDAMRVSTLKEQIAHIKCLARDRAEGDTRDYDAEAEELRVALVALEDGAPKYIQEGLDFDFPPSTTIIPDIACRSLHGFLGAGWVAQQFVLPCDKVKEIYGKDLKATGYAGYSHSEEEGSRKVQERANGEEGAGGVCVFEVYDKATRTVFTVADGVDFYLRAPAAPHAPLERFWPFFALTFNDVEDDTCIFPPSDVELLMPLQREHNLSRQRLVEHRDANRPKHVAGRGMLDETDKANLQNSVAHQVIELNALAGGQKVADVLQPVPHNPIDPNLYEVGTVFEDTLKVVGGQEANIGGTGGATATESSIAESSRLSAIGSNADDLDDFLTELAQNASHLLLSQMSQETVKMVAGPGAIWPEMSNEDIAKDLWLEVRAGSSGRPNKAMEIQNLERLLPFLIQMPGMKPAWLVEHVLERYDERIDPADAVAEGLPSIVAANAMAKAAPVPGAGPAAPEAQGAQGGRGQEPVPAPASDAGQGPNTAADQPVGNLPPAPPPPIPPVAPT